jgi:3-phenylpropionate/trans-cinnamate dioxygenase ferredoxin reductase subunit
MRDLDRADDDVAETTLRTVGDAERLRPRVAQADDVVIVGAGILGMELASGCLHYGCQVTVIDGQRPLVRQLGRHLAATVLRAATRQGLRFVVDPDIRLTAAGDRTLVRLSDGRILAPDLVVTAVGDVPNDDWLRPGGLAAAHGGLTVDARGLLAPNIAAAGDVAAYPTPLGHRRTPFWNSAVDQAVTAATSLLGGDTAPAYVARPYFWTEQFGLSIKVCGRLPAAGQPQVIPHDAQPEGQLLLWGGDGIAATAAAVNYRLPIPRLRALLTLESKQNSDSGHESTLKRLY